MSTFIVAGGATGLGREITLKLSAQGRVIVLSPFQADLDDVAAALGCDTILCDITHPEQVASAIKTVMERYGGITGLVNSVGVWLEGNLETNDPERIRRAVEVNVTGAMFLLRAVIEPMRRQGGGRIINIVSQAAFVPVPGKAVYAATKAGLANFIRSMEQELVRDRINVGSIHPGRMATSFYATAGNPKDLTTNDWLDPRVVASLVAFLFSLPIEVIVSDVRIRHWLGA